MGDTTQGPPAEGLEFVCSSEYLHKGFRPSQNT